MERLNGNYFFEGAETTAFGILRKLGYIPNHEEPGRFDSKHGVVAVGPITDENKLQITYNLDADKVRELKIELPDCDVLDCIYFLGTLFGAYDNSCKG